MTAQLRADDAALSSLRGKRVLAFAGIGDPDRFFRTLRANGVEVVSHAPLPIIIRSAQREIEALVAEAKSDALTLVTTEKDLARLGAGGELPPWAQGIVPFPVKLEFDSALRAAAFRVRPPVSGARREISEAPNSVQDFSAAGKCRCSTAAGCA